MRRLAPITLLARMTMLVQAAELVTRPISLSGGSFTAAALAGDAGAAAGAAPPPVTAGGVTAKAAVLVSAMRSAAEVTATCGIEGTSRQPRGR
ncbi:MAG: hypothetical protein JO263_00800 [Candidatus Eremiobacteraeota bacterium]|nr:hypothetical protein [Candidatus Eremiobacteraeota bacterium]